MLVLIENINYNFNKNNNKLYIDLETEYSEKDLREFELIMDTKGIDFILKYSPKLFKFAIEENINTIYLSSIKDNVSSLEDETNPLLNSIKYMKGMYIDENTSLNLIEVIKSLKNKYNWNNGKDSTKYEYLYSEGLSGNQKLISIKDKTTNNVYIELHDSHGEILFSKDKNEILTMLNLM